MGHCNFLWDQDVRYCIIEFLSKDSGPSEAAAAPDVSGLPRAWTWIQGDSHALNLLSRADPRKVQIGELRFLGVLSVEETAEVLKSSPRTVMRDWNAAKAWLFRELRGAPDGPSPVETIR